MNGSAAAAAHAVRATATSGAERPDGAGPSNPAADGPVPTAQLQAQADRAYTQEWTEQEQKVLEQGLSKWPADKSQPLERYLKIAASLPLKGARDVALRVLWMQREAKQKRQHEAVYGRDSTDAARGNRRPAGQSIFAVTATQPAAPATDGMVPMMPMPPGMMGQLPPGMSMPGMPAMPMPYALPQMPAGPSPVQLDDHGANGVGVVGGPISQLLDANYSILNTFKANMQAFKVEENTHLLMAFRDNILSILNHMNALGGVMAEMPPLPVRMNVEVANNFLPKAIPGYGMPVMPMMTGGYVYPGMAGMNASMPQAAGTSAAPAATPLAAALPIPAVQPQSISLPAAVAPASAAGPSTAAAATAAPASRQVEPLPIPKVTSEAPPAVQQDQQQQAAQGQQPGTADGSPATAVASSSPVVSPDGTPAAGSNASPPALTSAPAPAAAAPATTPVSTSALPAVTPPAATPAAAAAKSAAAAPMSHPVQVLATSPAPADAARNSAQHGPAGVVAGDATPASAAAAAAAAAAVPTSAGPIVAAVQPAAASASAQQQQAPVAAHAVVSVCLPVFPVAVKQEPGPA